VAEHEADSEDAPAPAGRPGHPSGAARAAVGGVHPPEVSPAAVVMAKAERGVGRSSRGPLDQVNFFVVGFTGALGVLTAWLLVLTLDRAQGIFINFLVALFLAVGLNPVVEFLRRRGLPRWAAIVAVCLALVAFAAGFLWTIVPPLTQQVAAFIADVPRYFQMAQQNPLLADLERRFELLERAQGLLTSSEF